MIKSVILSTLVLSSAFAQSVQSPQSYNVQGYYENSVSESNFNEMRRDKRKMKIDLYYAYNYGGVLNTIYAEPNKCYPVNNKSSAKMGDVRGKKGAVMFCASTNCTGACVIVLRRSVSQIGNINSLYGASRNSFSVSWISPYF
ncbi:hypothetical protein AX774_g5156 [Zancudomyces culisetae]|uniref:Uncharacterized protein n=1 Tax=Zancudomyces culisetae TaxID=1213189 RepID=A0A1R1PKC7_ZANCU|nr:hypothetical protein AX774_g5156 [Zancudomyces culisetae]|eukprot:OMH81389.1 hypothetical protein AX774_g5156 [Zancudomyces culisetae]